jgi:glutamyl-tRNA synthetase
VFRQSERFDLYEREFQRLKASGRVYACYETPEELDLRRKVLLGRGLPPVYERKPEGSPVPEDVAPHWRFRLDDHAPIAWNDAIRGAQKFDPKLISDPVVRRADGSWLYLLPSVIDDIDMQVSHVVRGEDHVSNSAVQIQMFDALGSAPPTFAHEALLVASEGKLSKRLGSSGVADLRDLGIEPMALNSLLARLGTSQPVEAKASLAELADGFDLATFGRAPAHFDLAEVEQVNRKLLHHLPFIDVADRVPDGIGADEWAILAGNVDHLGDLADWLPVLDGEITVGAIDPDDSDFLALAAELAEGLEWNDKAWESLTTALKERTGRKGKALFHPLRKVLTGRDSGPEMAPLVARIGKRRTLSRLRAVATPRPTS